MKQSIALSGLVHGVVLALLMLALPDASQFRQGDSDPIIVDLVDAASLVRLPPIRPSLPALKRDRLDDAVVARPVEAAEEAAHPEQQQANLDGPRPADEARDAASAPSRTALSSTATPRLKPPVQQTAPRDVATARGIPHDRGGDSTTDYYARLEALVRKYNAYPAEAEAQGLRGTVVVQFVVDSRGKVLDRRVVRSSGHAMLDRAALLPLTLAQPLPPFPPEIPADRISINYAIEYGAQ